MKFIELKTSKGQRWLFDHESGWEIFDNGDKPALWANSKEGRNADSSDPYEVVKAKLQASENAKLLQELAVAAMQGICANPLWADMSYENGAIGAIKQAQALVSELGKLKP